MPLIASEPVSAEAVSRLRRRFQRGFSRNSLAAVFNSGSTFLVNVAVANLLGRQVFGEFTIVQSTILTVTNMTSLAVGLTATKYIAEFRGVQKERAGRILGLCSLLAIVAGTLATLATILSSRWLAGRVLNAPQLSLGLIAASGAIFFNILNGYQTGALTGLEAYGAIARAAIVSGTCYLLFCVAGALVWGREGALAGLAVSGGVQWLALRHALRRECRSNGLQIRYDGIGAERGILLMFSLPAALSGLSTMPALWVASLFVARQDGGYQQIALYGAASNLRVLALFVPQLLTAVSLPMLNNFRGSGEWGQYRHAYRSTVVLVTAVALGEAAVIALCGPLLLRLFGRDFRGGYPVLLVLLAAAVVEASMIAVYQVVQAEARMWSSMLLIALPRDVLIVVFSYLFRSPFGALGLASAYTIGWTVALVITILIVVRIGLGPRYAEEPPIVGEA